MLNKYNLIGAVFVGVIGLSGASFADDGATTTVSKSNGKKAHAHKHKKGHEEKCASCGKAEKNCQCHDKEDLSEHPEGEEGHKH